MGVLNLSNVKAVLFDTDVNLTNAKGEQFTWPAQLPVSIAGKEVTITESPVKCLLMTCTTADSGDPIQVFRVDRVEDII